MPLQVQETSYYCVQSWMVNKLKLTGNNLVIYAIIHGFSMEENSWFSGSIQYLCAWTNSTKQGVYKNLKYLCENGFLLKKSETINGVIFNSYKTVIPENLDKNTPIKSNEKEHTIAEVGGGKQSLQGVNKVYHPSKQSLPSNIVNNIVNIPSNLSKDSIEGIAHPEGGDATHTSQTQCKNNQIYYHSGETKKESNGGCFRGKRSLISNPPTPLSEEDLVGKVTNTKTRTQHTDEGSKQKNTQFKRKRYLESVKNIVAMELNLHDTDRLQEIVDWFDSIYDKGVTTTKGVRFRKCMLQLIDFYKKYSWSELQGVLDTCTQNAYCKLDYGLNKSSRNTIQKSAKYFDMKEGETVEEWNKRYFSERRRVKDAVKTDIRSIYNTEDIK